MSAQPVEIRDITAALRRADVDYRVRHAGTDLATVILTRPSGDEIALGLDDEGVSVGYYDGTVDDGNFGTQDWHPTAAAAVASLRTAVKP